MAIKHSKWGPVQQEYPVAEGITFVSTAGHGGYVLSEGRAMQLQRKFPEFKSSFSTRTEFEEDCDYRVVVVAFPECFSDEQVAFAVMGIKRDAFRDKSIWAHVDAVISQDRSEDNPVARSDRWLLANMNNYWISGSFSNGKERRTFLKRIGDGHRVEVPVSLCGNVVTAEQVDSIMAEL